MANCQSYSTIFVFPRVLASCLQQPSSSSLSRFCFVAVELSTSIRPCFSTRFGAYPYSTVNVDMKSEGLNQLISFDDGGVVELGYIIYIYMVLLSLQTLHCSPAPATHSFIFRCMQ